VPLPISYQEILLTSSIMDSIFQQLRDKRTKTDANLEHHSLAIDRSV